MIPMMGVVLMALKGHSFVLTNYSLEKQSTEEIPNSLGHYLYFLSLRRVGLTRSVAPTLLYELAYPRTQTIRLRYIVQLAVPMLVCFALMYVIMMQFVNPILSDTTSNIIYRIFR